MISSEFDPVQICAAAGRDPCVKGFVGQNIYLLQKNVGHKGLGEVYSDGVTFLRKITLRPRVILLEQPNIGIDRPSYYTGLGWMHLGRNEDRKPGEPMFSVRDMHIKSFERVYVASTQALSRGSKRWIRKFLKTGRTPNPKTDQENCIFISTLSGIIIFVGSRSGREVGVYVFRNTFLMTTRTEVCNSWGAEEITRIKPGQTAEADQHSLTVYEDGEIVFERIIVKDAA